MRVTGAGSTASETDAVTVTGTILWLGGQRTFGEALALAKTGAVVSRTVTWKAPVAMFPARSVALALTVVMPRGNVDPDVTLSVTGRSPLSASWALAENVTTAPAEEVASAVMSAGRLRTGAVLSTRRVRVCGSSALPFWSTAK